MDPSAPLQKKQHFGGGSKPASAFTSQDLWSSGPERGMDTCFKKIDPRAGVRGSQTLVSLLFAFE